MTTISEKPTVSTTSAKPLKSPVIVCDSWGNYYVYPATIEFAKKLVQDKIDELGETTVAGMGVLKGRKAFAANPDDLTIPYLVSDDVVLRGMKDLLSLEVGQESRALYRLATPGTLEKDIKLQTTKAQRDELVLWSFENKFNAASASASDLEKTRPEKSLSFMSGIVSRANGHPLKYVYGSDMDDAEELQSLLYGTWKPTAKIENVVQRYLTLLNNYCHRDEKYHLGVMEFPLVE
jgi:hypothetical protein